MNGVGSEGEVQNKGGRHADKPRSRPVVSPNFFSASDLRHLLRCSLLCRAPSLVFSFLLVSLPALISSFLLLFHPATPSSLVSRLALTLDFLLPQLRRQTSDVYFSSFSAPHGHAVYHDHRSSGLSPSKFLVLFLPLIEAWRRVVLLCCYCSCVHPRWLALPYLPYFLPPPQHHLHNRQLTLLRAK